MSDDAKTPPHRAPQTLEGLNLVDPITHLRKHPDLYGFRHDWVPDWGHELAHRLVGAAQFLTRAPVTYFPEGDWWVVAAASDWLKPDAGPLRAQFRRMTDFAEYGFRHVRPEVFLAAFARDVLTCAGPDREVLWGDVAEDDPIWETCGRAPQQGRIVAFRGWPKAEA